MSTPMTARPSIQANLDREPCSVSVRNLGSDLADLLVAGARSEEILKSVLRVTVAQPTFIDPEPLPDVAGRYNVFNDQLEFTPSFPFESDVKYRAIFDPRSVKPRLQEEPSTLEFQIPPAPKAQAHTAVTHIFPSSHLLPENLLRFYVCFSNSMRRGEASHEIRLLDSVGQHVSDALYRPPVELWDKAMRSLTVLLDPGRLKRWLGPHLALGPPLRVGEKYTLEIDSGMIDLHGRPLGECFRKDFRAGNPVREQLAVNSWKLLPPATGSREPLMLEFEASLDWAQLFWMITVSTTDGVSINGEVIVDRCETRWCFTPNSPWAVGKYRIRVRSGLEDVCGNNLSGAFDRPLRRDPNRGRGENDISLAFHLV
jgi:hypothetical protein